MKVRISVPRLVEPGSVIEIKTLASHPMETGFRRDHKGAAIPRDIITHFECMFAGSTVFDATFGPGIAANPFLSFHMRAEASGTLLFRWTDQHGNVTEAARDLTVGDA